MSTENSFIMFGVPILSFIWKFPYLINKLVFVNQISWMFIDN
jgi:hypothetical protein